MLNRRGLLAGIFAAGAAPAIASSNNLMKIFVPRQEIFFPGLTTVYPEGNTVLDGFFRARLLAEYQTMRELSFLKHLRDGNYYGNSEKYFHDSAKAQIANRLAQKHASQHIPLRHRSLQ